ncbi:MAG TPA: hypothetical protein VN725_10710 [Rhodanobacteraceae bacterium]|nr:hypothetical protein [Rhodanobacteraceae bacterium]
MPQRILAGSGQHHVADVIQYGLDGQQVAVVVIHDQDACPLEFMDRRMVIAVRGLGPEGQGFGMHDQASPIAMRLGE